MHSKSTLSRRLPTALAVAATTLLALPASGVAAETFGSRLINPPTTGGCSMLTAPCTYVSFIHPSDPDGDPYANGAPSDGVITKFRIRASGAGASVTFRVANITRDNPDSAQASAAGTGPTVTIAGTGETAVEEFPGRLPVKKGNHLAIDTTSANAIYDSSGEKFTYGFSTPLLVDGAAARTSDAVHGELLVAATVEPDTDKDGFGDETQDRCLGQVDANGGCPPNVDTIKPRLNGLSLSKKAFKKSSKLTYGLSERATVTVRVERIKKGRKVGGKCRKQTAANIGRKACKRFVKLPGRIQKTTPAGIGKLTLKSRIGGRKLAPGRYRLVATAKDGAGNVSAPKRLGFRVKR
jgi:hypothetical protein